MQTKRKQRLMMIACMMLGLGAALALALYALSQNINLFFTPSQIVKHQAPLGRLMRIGGLVKLGSVQYAKQGLTVKFIVTDTHNEVVVKYAGVLPDLFREGQGIVTLGQLNSDYQFIASQVLAKHDENYMPAEVHLALQRAAPNINRH